MLVLWHRIPGVDPTLIRIGEESLRSWITDQLRQHAVDSGPYEACWITNHRLLLVLGLVILGVCLTPVLLMPRADWLEAYIIVSMTWVVFGLCIDRIRSRHLLSKRRVLLEPATY